MSSSQNKPATVRLTDDGELIEDVQEGGSVYCTNCGAKNQPDSNFCRNCGESMQEQAGRPARKSKDSRSRLDAAVQPHGDPAAIAFFGVLRLLIVGVLALIMASTLPFPVNFIVPVVLIAIGLVGDKIFK